METYTLLREFADSWFLLAMVLFFSGVVLYTLRPGSKATHDDIANIPLRNDTLPKDGCEDCGKCTCKTDFLTEEERHGLA